MKQLVLLAMLFCSSSMMLAATIRVNNAAQLQTANQDAKPGDIIVMENGIWIDIQLLFTCKGTAAKPITFKAANSGKVIIGGNSSLQIGGDWLIIDGLVFTDGYRQTGHPWEFRVGKQVANNCRVTNCLIESFNHPNRMKESYWVALYGKNNRIDHCSFINKTNLGVLMAVILDDDRSRLNNHSIDSNFFGIRKPLGSNGGEIIRVGVSEHCTFYSNTQIVNNVFSNCDGETEIISIKSCGNIIRNNIFRECQGAVVLRHGNNNTVESNLFLGFGKKGTGGVRVINEGNWIVNNFFSHCVGEGFRSPLAIMNGVFNSPPNRYLPVRDAVIVNNTFSNCTPFSVCEGSDTERTVVPKNVYIQNNLFYSDKSVKAFQYFDKIDSVFFSGNVINSNITKTIEQGFEQKPVSVAKIFDNPFPTYTQEKIKILLPDSIKAMATKRLATGLSDGIGVTGTTFFMNLAKNAHRAGVRWKNNTTVETYEPKRIVFCKTAAEIYAALNGKEKNIEIMLTGNKYMFEQPVSITKNILFSSKQSNILFASANELSSLFMIAANASLQMNGLQIDASKLNAPHFITADSSGAVIHFSINIQNCSFQHLPKDGFLTLFRSAYADAIFITNSTFTQSNTLFNLQDERENKGYYNVEKMLIDRCLFTNNTGQLVNIYRGGNDESTMGPAIIFTNNSIRNCNADNALIYLFGVQQSTFLNNVFNDSNKEKIVLFYGDSVRAKHEQKNNQLINAGIISENKFVFTLK